MLRKAVLNWRSRILFGCVYLWVWPLTDYQDRARQPWKLLRLRKLLVPDHTLQPLVTEVDRRCAFQEKGSSQSFLPSAVCLGAANLAVGRMPEQRQGWGVRQRDVTSPARLPSMAETGRAGIPQRHSGLAYLLVKPMPRACNCWKQKTRPGAFACEPGRNRNSLPGGFEQSVWVQLAEVKKALVPCLVPETADASKED